MVTDIVTCSEANTITLKLSHNMPQVKIAFNASKLTSGLGNQKETPKSLVTIGP